MQFVLCYYISYYDIYIYTKSKLYDISVRNF